MFKNIIFFSVAGCLILLMGSFAVQKLLSLIRSHVFIFASTSFALGDWSKKTLPQFMLENVLPMFSSRSFMVSCLRFHYFYIWLLNAQSDHWSHWWLEERRLRGLGLPSSRKSCHNTSLYRKGMVLLCHPLSLPCCLLTNTDTVLYTECTKMVGFRSFPWLLCGRRGPGVWFQSSWGPGIRLKREEEGSGQMQTA